MLPERLTCWYIVTCGKRLQMRGGAAEAELEDAKLNATLPIEESARC